MTAALALMILLVDGVNAVEPELAGKAIADLDTFIALGEQVGRFEFGIAVVEHCGRVGGDTFDGDSGRLESGQGVRDLL